MTTEFAQPPVHVVQFYDAEREVIDMVSRYLAGALRDDEVAIVAATAPHLAAFEEELGASGLDLQAARAEGRWISFDAGDAVSALLIDGHIDRGAFFEYVGGLLRGFTGRKVRVYGEIVAVLWDAGHVNAAVELEALWNDLRALQPFELFCSYPSSLFADPDHASALEEVCGLHSEVICRHLCEESAPRGDEVECSFEQDAASPSRARHFVIRTLQAWSLEDLAPDAALVVSELATNAVLHGQSSFDVTLSLLDSGLRIGVRDSSRLEPVPRDAPLNASSGRGLELVEALSARWGAVLLADGKVIWAELDLV